MSKIKINATKSGLKVSAEGWAAQIIGGAVAVAGLAATMHYFPVW